MKCTLRGIHQALGACYDSCTVFKRYSNTKNAVLVANVFRHKHTHTRFVRIIQADIGTEGTVPGDFLIRFFLALLAIFSVLTRSQRKQK